MNFPKTRRILSYASFISNSGKRRKPSLFREVLSQIQTPGMINLAEGSPTSAIFPVEKFIVSLKDGTHISLYDATVRESSGNYYFARYGFNYMLAFMREYQNRVHHMPYNKTEDWQLIISATSTPGSQNVLFQAFDTILDEGDSIFLENPTCGETIYLLNQIGITMKPIETDQNGLIPESLEASIHAIKEKGETLPKVLYIMPIGQNPTGITLTYERKEKIYEICSIHNILIFEDDPYWNDRYLDVPPSLEYSSSKSFLHIDTDHRVIRFDSFCNLFSSGVRFGFVTGPTPIMEIFKLQQASTSPPAGLAQAVLFQLLIHYGEKGLDENIRNLREFLTQKKKEFFAICDKHLRRDNLVEWVVPIAGMFCWFKLKGIEDSQEICNELSSHRLLMVPGIIFCSNNETKSPHIRVCFIPATRNEIETGIERFARTLREHSLKDNQKIE